MELITSKNNNLIKLIRQLKQKKYRDKLGKFLVEGNLLVEEALKWTNSLEEVLVSEEFLAKTAKNSRILKLIQDKNIRMAVIADNLFFQLTETEAPQGILGVVTNGRKSAPDDFPEELSNTCLILNNIQDPGNLGTLIRTADAAGFDRVFLTKGTVDLFNLKVLRAAMGSHFHLDLDWIENEISFIEKLKEQKVTIAVADIQGAENIYSTKLPSPLVLVLGNEGNGPSQEWLQAADLVVKIPLLGKAESLNVSIAGAVIMYEIVRQNKLSEK